MKKVILILSFLLIFTACSNSKLQNEIKDEMRDFKEDINEVLPNKNPSTSDFIGEDKAKEIALNRAQLSGDDVYFERVDLENDNGKWHYEIEFQKGSSEYEVDIDSVSGEIISFKKEINE